MNKSIIWSLPKEVFEECINKNMTCSEIAKKFGVSRGPLLRLFRKYGFHTNGNLNRDRNAKFNIHKFDVIDTEEKAFWLGVFVCRRLCYGKTSMECLY